MTNTIQPETGDGNPLSILFSQYQRLCQYCDRFFTKVQQTFQTQMQCRQGCSACCILETVVPLEAHIIVVYLQSLTSSQMSTILSDKPEQSEKPCVFLVNDECAIYPVRPIICRTHGLPIKYPDRQEIDACPLNFTGIEFESIDPQYVFDTESITDNLIRLNLAFSMLTRQIDDAGKRIPLTRLLTEYYPLEEFTQYSA